MKTENTNHLRKLSTVISLLFALILSACASSQTLNQNALDIRSSMNSNQAYAVLKKYITPNDKRGGLCLIDLMSGATLDTEKKLTMRDSVIAGYGYFVTAKQALQASTTKTNAVKTKTSSDWQLDTRAIKEIRLLDKNVERLNQWCKNVQPPFMVVIKSTEKLRNNAEISINVTTNDELDELLAALTYLSPGARLVGGTGM